MKFVALLRGINVGGNNVIKMAALKTAVEQAGFQNVATYIQSGNLIFESDETNTEKITKQLEKLLSETFHYNSRLVLRSYSQLKKVVQEAPLDWKNRKDIRCYVAFLRDSVTAQNALKEIELKEGIDFIKTGQGVLYLTTLLSRLTKSKFNRLPSKKIYQEMTIRNYNTTKKLLALME